MRVADMDTKTVYTYDSATQGRCRVVVVQAGFVRLVSPRGFSGPQPPYIAPAQTNRFIDPRWENYVQGVPVLYGSEDVLREVIESNALGAFAARVMSGRPLDPRALLVEFFGETAARLTLAAIDPRAIKDTSA